MTMLKSVWAVVCNATDPDSNRLRAYHQACKAFVERGEWREYTVVRHSRFNQIIGYRRRDPNDWFTYTGDQTLGGPFRSKKEALASLLARRSTQIAAGHYHAKGADVMRREVAEHVIGRKL